MTKGENKTKAQDTGGLKIGKSSLIAFGAKMSLALIGFIGLVFFYRRIGSVGIGIYYTILGVGKLINSLQGGIQSAIKKRVSEVDASQSEYLGLGVIVLAVVTAITAIIITVGIFLQPQLLQLAGRFSAQEEIKRIINNLSYLFAALGIAISLSIFGLTNQFYAGIGNPGKSQWMDTTRSLLTLGVQALLIFIGFETFGLVWGFITGTMIVTISVIISVNIRPSVPSKETVIRTFSYAKWSIPLGFLNNVYSKLDIFLITSILGAGTSGVYALPLE
jgi:O-antigen/teichoic acid export membrane protein